MSVALVQAAARVEQDAEQQPSRVPHHLPGIHVLHAPGTELLEPGMAFSVEPGIYPGPHGARIEDIVVCTADGVERLNHTPRELVVVA